MLGHQLTCSKKIIRTLSDLNVQSINCPLISTEQPLKARQFANEIHDGYSQYADPILTSRTNARLSGKQGFNLVTCHLYIKHKSQ